MVEADHGKLKQLSRPVRGFNTLKTAYATIQGFELTRALRKGQAAIFNLTLDIRGEARIVERALGFGLCVLAETIQLVSERKGLKTARQSYRHAPQPRRSFATEPSRLQSIRLGGIDLHTSDPSSLHGARWALEG